MIAQYIVKGSLWVIGGRLHYLQLTNGIHSWLKEWSQNRPIRDRRILVAALAVTGFCGLIEMGVRRFAGLICLILVSTFLLLMVKYEWRWVAASADSLEKGQLFYRGPSPNEARLGQGAVCGEPGNARGAL